MRRLAAAAFLAFAAALVSLAPASHVRAQGFVFEETERFDVRVVIEDSGTLVVRETIVQQFGSTPRHGIFRFIPNRLRYDDTYDRVYPIDLISVTTSPGTPDDVETGEQDGNFTIRIGDPDVEITGRHMYEIVYRVEGAMNGFETHDELYWNAIGDRVGAADPADDRSRGRPRRGDADRVLPGPVRIHARLRPRGDQERQRRLLAAGSCRRSARSRSSSRCRRCPS